MTKAIRQSIAIICILFSMAFCASSQADENSLYDSELAKVKACDESSDFTKLRLLYSKTAKYNPYASDQKKSEEMYRAFNEGKFEEAVSYANLILDKNYVDLDAHLLLTFAYQEIGNSERSGFHDFVVNGLLNSILASGDGESPKTAFVVITDKEEYAILQLLELQADEQKLVNEDGHSYDVFKATDLKTGQSSVLYFNVDIPLGWLGKKI
ncbi:MAG: DUF4919 domain-containing protein [Thermodesulfovibrionia bacterium]|nr:DUF4919 domain-containing protein [Thermodesulfovibrionia bacterium]